MSARFERGLLERAAHLRRTAAAWEAGEESGREGLRVAAHRLKGIAGSCGHPDLGAWAARVEEAAKASERPRGVEEARALAAEADRRGAVAVARDGVPWAIVLEPVEELRLLADRALARVDDLDATVLGSVDPLETLLGSRRRCAVVVVPADAPPGLLAAARRMLEARPAGADGEGRVPLVALDSAEGPEGQTTPPTAVDRLLPRGPGPRGLVAAVRAAARLGPLDYSSFSSSRSSSS
jgi:HPt (histidine-containing phosphotransfer) domain-containing protein